MNYFTSRPSGLSGAGDRVGSGLSPEPVVERLSRYRRALEATMHRGGRRLFSHELATLAGASSAQVRRDLMEVSVEGSPRHGYDVEKLREAISYHLLGGEQACPAVLVGLGRLGRALLSYFVSRKTGLRFVAAFDTDPNRVGRVVEGCHAYPMEQLASHIARQDVRVAALTVPPEEAQAIADELVSAGITGLANFAPIPLEVPRHVFVENVDLTMWLEKVAYFARHPSEELKAGRK